MDIISSSKDNRKRKVKLDDDSSTKKLKTHELHDLDIENKRLEKLVIGDENTFIRNISLILNNDSGLESSSDERDDCESQHSDTLASPPRQPAWEDEDDNYDLTTEEAFSMKGWRSTSLDGNISQNYQMTLRRKFISIFGEPSWAKLNNNKSDDEDSSILRSCGKFIKKSNDLPKTVLNTKQVTSLNGQTRNEGHVINVVEFHPTMAVALVAGISGTASIFQVDGRINSKLSSVQFERFPIRCGKFTKDGNKFVVGSNIHSHFHIYDMVAGKSLRISLHHNMEQTNMKSFLISPDGSLIAARGRFGNIHLLTTSSYEWIGNLKMNNNVTAIAFNSDGSILYSHSDIGEMYAWDMSSRTAIGRWMDEGCISGTCLAVSPDNRLLATGQSSGVVNVYSTSSFVSCLPPYQSVPPKPIHSFPHLTTSASFVQFDSSSQLLAIGSSEKDNSIKLCHTPSMTVFCNFPSQNASLKRVQCAAFSPNSGFFSFGNNSSTAYLYRIKHFGNY